MKPHRKHRHTLALLLIAALIGWLIGRKLHTHPDQDQQTAIHQHPPRPRTPKSRLHPIPHAINHLPDGTTVEIFSSQNPNEVIIRFPTYDTYSNFLANLTPSSIVIVSKLDRLHAIRLGFQQIHDLELFLHSENINIAPSLSLLPEPSPDADLSQEGLLAFGDTLLAWLEIHSDHFEWGAGVKIAVVDSGIVPHENLPSLLKSLAITPFPSDPSQINGHGTAVASLIAGVSARAPGLALSAQLISIRVSNDSGKADCFAMAAGILAAADERVDVINISMGAAEDNPLIRDAILYAQEKQILIVASSGNSGKTEANFPAAYPGVFSVGAVDANGTHLRFSNYGDLLTLTAPGLALNAAWPGNLYVRTSGTSASAAIVTGAIAATMSDGSGRHMSAAQAAEILTKHAYDAGLPGPDTQYGFGILSLNK